MNMFKEYELRFNHTTAFSLKGFSRTDINVSLIVFGEDIQVLVFDATFRERYPL